MSQKKPTKRKQAEYYHWYRVSHTTTLLLRSFPLSLYPQFNSTIPISQTPSLSLCSILPWRSSSLPTLNHSPSIHVFLSILLPPSPTLASASSAVNSLALLTISALPMPCALVEGAGTLASLFNLRGAFSEHP